MRPSTILLLAVALATTVASPAAASEPLLCPWRTVAHPEHPFIQYLGKWAVQQYSATFTFDKVESARAQCVGANTSKTRYYELIIDAAIRYADPGEERFRAVVFVMNFKFPMNLTSFELVKIRPAGQLSASLQN